jgi:hypothetical protein
MDQVSSTQPLKSEINSLKISAGIFYGLAAIFLALAGTALASLGGVNGFVCIALCGGILFVLAAVLIGKRANSFRAALPLIEGKKPFELNVQMYGSASTAIVWLDKVPTEPLKIDPSQDLIIIRKGGHPLIIPGGLLKPGHPG